MKENKFSYIQTQLLKVAPFPLYNGSLNGEFNIQISSDKGKTNWIGISANQMRAIEKILEEDTQ
jgi:hypothetical protein